MSAEVTDITCCPDFVAGCQDETDNEGYRALIQREDCMWNDEDGLIHIGCGLKPIQFCPWCGKKIQKVAP